MSRLYFTGPRKNATRRPPVISREAGRQLDREINAFVESIKSAGGIKALMARPIAATPAARKPRAPRCRKCGEARHMGIRCE